jgi:long-chain acyl-CoA synthetase
MYEDVAAGGDASRASVSVEVGPDDDATIMYTSGTTNHPKGVVSTHRNILNGVNMLGVATMLNARMAAAAAAAAGAGGGAAAAPAHPDAVLLAVPLFHCTATHAVLFPSFFNGRKIVIM